MKTKSFWLGAVGLFLVSAAGFIASEAAKTFQNFFSECAAKAGASAQAGKMTVVGKEGWLFFGPELRHLSVGQFWGEPAAQVSKATKSAQADPLPAILDFKTQLDKAGVELLLVPVPAKAIIYPDMLSDKLAAGKDGFSRLDIQHQSFYAELRKNGVKVLDLVPEFLRRRQEGTNQLFSKQDTHWSGQACVLTAKLIAQEIQTRPWFSALAKQKFSPEWRTVELNGDLWKELTNNPPPKETLPLRFVGKKAGTNLQPVEPDRSSPVILLGDSHNLIFHAGDDMQAKGAGLADQLAIELGFAVDLIGVRGSGATPARVNLARRTRPEPDYLAKKKLVIWCFTVREFTESSGWQKVALSK